MNRIVLRDAIDYDYVDKLNDKDKAFLDKFTNEYYSADFRPTKKKKACLNRSKKSRRDIYKSNNSRNTDTTSYLWNFNQLESFEDLKENKKQRGRNTEDALIKLIDKKNSLK